MRKPSQSIKNGHVAGSLYILSIAIPWLVLLIMLVFPLVVLAAGTTINGTVPLTIRDVIIDNITSAGVTVQWTTNASADSQLYYDTVHHTGVADYTYQPAADAALVTAHHQALTGLTPATLYYLRLQSAAVIDGTEYTALSGEFILTTLANNGGSGGGGGGGGGGSGPENLTMSLELTGAISDTDPVLNLLGQTQQPFTLTSADGNCTIALLQGTYLRDVYGKPLTGLSMAAINAPPEAPPAYVILAAYNFGPDGARFNPAVTLTFKFDPQSLPAGVIPGALKLAVWDGSAWQILDGEVDTAANTISAGVTHFSDFALVGPAPAVTSTTTSTTSDAPVVTTIPVPVQTEITVLTTAAAAPESPPATVTITLPAAAETGRGVITMSDLKIRPSRVKPGEPVDISFLLTGDDIETPCTVTLKINELDEDSRTVSLPENGSLVVSFTVSRNSAGEYRVDVEGLTGIFTVVEPLRFAWLWWVIGAGIAVIIAGVILCLRRAFGRSS